jgi:hypothetical protein
LDGREEDLATIRALLDRGEVEQALEHSLQLHSATPTDAAIASMVARARLAYGRALIASADADARAVRAAFDQFSAGLALGDLAPDLAATLRAEQGYARTFIAVAGLTRRMGAAIPDGSEAAADQHVEQLLALLDVLEHVPIAFPGGQHLHAESRIRAALAYERRAANDPRRQANYVPQIYALCAEASALAVDENQRQEASACMARVAAQPTPQIEVGSAAFVAEIVRSFPRAEPSRESASCIEGSVRVGAAGVANATGNVNNGVRFAPWKSDAAGHFRVCGLGASTWSVVLLALPVVATPIDVHTIVQVDGTATQVAQVDFLAP